MKRMVDVCVRKMTLEEIIHEIRFRISRSPRRLVIDIKRRKEGYYTTIYIPKKDFEGRNQKEEKC